MPAGNSFVCQQGWICVERAGCCLGLEKYRAPQELWRVRVFPPPRSLSTKVPPCTYRPVTAPDTVLAMLATHLAKAVAGLMVCRRKKNGFYG